MLRTLILGDIMEPANRGQRVRVSGTRRSVLFVIVGAVLALSSSALVWAQVSSDVAEPAPTPGASSKAAAAAADLKAENQRLDAAERAFASDLTESPGSIHDYLVSLAEPVQATAVLDREQLGVTAIYTWMHAPGSLYPKTGYWDLSTFPSGMTPAEVTAQIAADVQTYLGDRTKEIEALLASGDITAASAKAQLAEVMQLRARLSDGVEIYGFRCTCSPQSLADLATVSLHAVEGVKDTGGAEPVWPANPLRDQLLSD